MSLLKTKIATIKLSNLKWSFLQHRSSTRTSVETIIELKNSSQDFTPTRQETYSDVKGRLSGDKWEFKQENVLEIEECNLPKIRFQLNSWRKEQAYICFTSEVHQNHNAPDLYPLFPFPANPEGRMLKKEGKSLKFETKINFSNLSSRPTDMVFGIQPGSFSDCIIPETVRTLWGPIPLETLPKGVDNKCRAVTHGIVNGMEEKVMSVYLIHSLPLVLSAVQVFVGDKMAVVAHTIGPNTIGKLELDPEFAGVPWRAMIIKDNEGDFGICVGAWKGLTNGVTGVEGTKQIEVTPGLPGYFSMIFYNLRSGRVEKIRLPTHFGKNLLEMENLSVDWDEGLILAKKKDHNVAQNMCLAFVASTLYLLVQPRPDDVEAMEKEWNEQKMDPSIPLSIPPFLKNSAMVFLLHSGWKERHKIPSNSTMIYESKKKRISLDSGYGGYGSGSGGDDISELGMFIWDVMDYADYGWIGWGDGFAGTGWWDWGVGPGSGGGGDSLLKDGTGGDGLLGDGTGAGGLNGGGVCDGDFYGGGGGGGGDFYGGGGGGGRDFFGGGGGGGGGGSDFFGGGGGGGGGGSNVFGGGGGGGGDFLGGGDSGGDNCGGDICDILCCCFCCCC